MIAETPKDATSNKDMLARVHEGFRRIGLTFPHLVGLIQKMDVAIDQRVPTMGVFASGRLLVNPQFLQTLSTADLTFVLTHELMHLTLRTHERAPGSKLEDFNVAHDCIINDILREELEVTEIPAGGMDYPGARHLSAEALVEQLRQMGQLPSRAWQDPNGMDGWGDGAPDHDALSAETERRLFPGDNARAQAKKTKAIADEAAKALGLQALLDAMKNQGKGQDAAGAQESMSALRGLYRPPWELALQRWMESMAPGERTYARPSRRGADRTDVVLPGRKRESWTLHIVLDTSGSMALEVPRGLGAIADFCEALGVDRVHLIQCDTAIGSDEVLTPAEVHEWRVTGFGGSDLSAAMNRLAEDREVHAAIVLTDGDIDYPQEHMPYEVLWVLPTWKNPGDFQPRYGKVIGMH